MTAVTQNMRIIYRKDDGGVAIVTPAPIPDLVLEEVIERTVPTGAPYKIIDVSELPTETKYRNAWVWED
jgi:hypothetical protein